MNFSNFGPMIGAMAYDNYVEFWFKSLTGGETDTHQVMIPFKDAATAKAVASLVNMETPAYAQTSLVNNDNNTF